MIEWDRREENIIGLDKIKGYVFFVFFKYYVPQGSHKISKAKFCNFPWLSNYYHIQYFAALIMVSMCAVMRWSLTPAI